PAELMWGAVRATTRPSPREPWAYLRSDRTALVITTRTTLPTINQNATDHSHRMLPNAATRPAPIPPANRLATTLTATTRLRLFTDFLIGLVGTGMAHNVAPSSQACGGPRHRRG